jgi:hypothetical protein
MLWISCLNSTLPALDICLPRKLALRRIDPLEISVLTYKVLLSKPRSLIALAHKEGPG